jgi:hypothetical protein
MDGSSSEVMIRSATPAAVRAFAQAFRKSMMGRPFRERPTVRSRRALARAGSCFPVAFPIGLEAPAIRQMVGPTFLVLGGARFKSDNTLSHVDLSPRQVLDLSSDPPSRQVRKSDDWNANDCKAEALQGCANVALPCFTSADRPSPQGSV